jgi:uncharacterized protein
MAPADGVPTLSVTVAYSPAAGVVDEVSLCLRQGATLRDALQASGVLDRHPQIDLGAQRVGVWGTLKPLDALLRERDRVEVYRALQVDPKEARRQRSRGQRRKTG